MGTYLYGEGPAGPHAVTTAGGQSYSYDANGSMVSGDGTSITWSSFNKPVDILNSVTGDSASFVYGPDRARYKQTILKGAQTTEVTYIGSLYEKKTTAGAADKLVHYIRGGNGTVAIYTKIDDGVATNDPTRYLHKDHLGSIDVITNQIGAILEKPSFDPHGKRRAENWQPDETIEGIETPRGFTGHEHLDVVGLIHMNGRVYDPTLGRFLSADPFVQFPETTQGFNRYSYVNNNPLSFTDPSGFFISKKFAAKLFAQVMMALPMVIPGIQAVGLLMGSIIAATMTGFQTLSYGGDLGDFALTAGVSLFQAAGAYGVGEIFGHTISAAFTQNLHLTVGKAIAHGVVSGAASKLQGGKFKTGLIAGGIGSVAGAASRSISSNKFVQGVVTAVAGGASAELGGGKFINGAVTGAFIYLFNHGAGKTSGRFTEPQNGQAGGIGLLELLFGLGGAVKGAGKYAINSLRTKSDEVITIIKDVTRRPSNFRKKTVQDAWDNAADGSKSGTKACPTCSKDVEVAPGQGRRDWDVDHQPKWKDRDLSSMDRPQVLDEFNADTRLRCISCNRADN